MHSNSIGTILPALPEGLRGELASAFSQIERNYREGRWEPSELNGGKLCEVVWCILNGHLKGSYPAKASKPSNMYDACKALEKAPPTFPRSIRIQIPRLIIALYEIRNNRGVGHIGGDVDPNRMDAICVLQMAKWIVCELIRVFHDLSVEEASSIVDAISEREFALVWKVDGNSRILDTKMKMPDKTLVLLYGEPSGLDEKQIFNSLEHSNISVFRRDVLLSLHKKRLIEFNQDTRRAKISPLGAKRAEALIQTSSKVLK